MPRYDYPISTVGFLRVSDDVFGDLNQGFPMRQVVSHAFYGFQLSPRHSLGCIPACLHGH